MHLYKCGYRSGSRSCIRRSTNYVRKYFVYPHRSRRLTREDRGFEELHKLVDLDEHIDRHLELGAEEISIGVDQGAPRESLTRLEVDGMPVHKLGQGDKVRR